MTCAPFFVVRHHCGVEPSENHRQLVYRTVLTADSLACNVIDVKYRAAMAIGGCGASNVTFLTDRDLGYQNTHDDGVEGSRPFLRQQALQVVGRSASVRGVEQPVQSSCHRLSIVLVEKVL